MNKISYVLLSLCLTTTAVQADLNVIADTGGEDASVYFEGINRQNEPAVSPVVQPPVLLSQGEAEAAVLPVVTPELTPGDVVARPLQLPGLGALFIVGDDEASRTWLQANARNLQSRHAAGMVVNVSHLPALQRLRELAPGVPMAPASGSELSRRLQLSHYPVLITDAGLSQQVMP